jgi:thiol-disulfide isomerase/thioredoxin
MKKAIMLVTIFLIISLTTILIIGIVAKTKKSKIAEERIMTLPAFSMKTINDSIFRSEEIIDGPVLVLFYHPECEHCQYQITTLFKSKTLTPGLLVLLISNAEKKTIRSFLMRNNLLEYPGLIALVDETFSFKEYFGTELVPAIFIYNERLKLVGYFQGEVKPETILKYLRQDD